MTHYELATLTTVIGGAAAAAPGIEAFVGAPDAKGRLLGAWATEIGPLNQVFVLRGFDSAEDLLAERRRTRLSADPFGCGEFLTVLETDAYVPFDFVPPVRPGELGPFYEIRTYCTKVGGIAPTIERWRAAVPGRIPFSPLVVAMYALDGAPRITHIWPYRSLDERQRIRAKSVEAGVWPPKGGPDSLTSDMRSTIALPLAFSPLK